MVAALSLSTLMPSTNCQCPSRQILVFSTLGCFFLYAILWLSTEDLLLPYLPCEMPQSQPKSKYAYVNVLSVTPTSKPETARELMCMSLVQQESLRLANTTADLVLMLDGPWPVDLLQMFYRTGVVVKLMECI